MDRTRTRFAVRTPSRACLTMLAAAAVLLSACAKTSAGPSGATPPPPVTVKVADADNGKTVHVPQGSTVRVVLGSTYWTVQDGSNHQVLALQGAPTVLPSGGCVPGQGCGTVTATFRALAAGTSVITASRTTCGEALRCTGSEGSYRIVVIVDA
jgi:plastocyanin